MGCFCCSLPGNWTEESSDPLPFLFRALRARTGARGREDAEDVRLNVSFMVRLKKEKVIREKVLQ